MIADRNSGNTSPLTWVGSFPVYASTVLAMIHAATMVLTAIAMAAGAEALIQTFQFSSNDVLEHFRLWQVVTYAFVHPPQILFLLELYLLIMFGREIERFLGRRAFLQLYATLLLLPPLLLCVAGMAGYPTIFSGSSALHFCVFIAFATLYPMAEVFFSIQSRWVAIALLAISALQYLAYSKILDLGVLLIDAAAAFIIIQILRGEWTVDFHSLLPHKRSHLRVVETPRETASEVPVASIDSILEKISKSGMSSLTSKERTQLERARAALLEKDRNT